MSVQSPICKVFCENCDLCIEVNANSLYQAVNAVKNKGWGIDARYKHVRTFCPECTQKLDIYKFRKVEE